MANNPFMGCIEEIAKSRDYEYRSIVLCRPFKLIYFIDRDAIFIADIWDTRREPQSLIKRL